MPTRPPIHPIAPRLALGAVCLLGAWAAGLHSQAPASPQTSHARALETPLDLYVAAPDARFRVDVAGDLPAQGVTATLLDMTSQQWLTTNEVADPVWRHWLTVIRPPAVQSDIALLFITGGANDGARPTAPTRMLVDIARATGAVVAELRLVPNQPVVFQDDPLRKPRTEDDFIAYTWDKFLRTNDPKWPARLPMTKSAVRAMDAVTAFMASPAGGAQRVSRFVVSGASKRGWTTWTTAAVDSRVVAIAPIVIDMLNLEPSFVHHWRAYGAWADAVSDYVDRGLMSWMGTREFRALMKIEEPFEYRARLAMPKLIINAAGDEFFLPDSSRFYFDALPGEKQLRYIPNTGHNLEKTDAPATLQAFFASIVAGSRRPSFTWTFEADGSIRVVSKDRPTAVTFWRATNPNARDFRLTTIGRTYAATPLRPVGPNTWVARMSAPPKGWSAGFVELTFPATGGTPLTLTTAVRVLPDALPFPAPVPTPPPGSHPAVAPVAATPVSTEPVRAIAAARRPLPAEADSAGVSAFSFIVYGDTRGRQDGTAVQYEHSLVVDGMLATIKQLESSDAPVRFVLQSGDAVVNGRDPRQWNVSFVDLINRITTEAGVPYFLAPGNHDVTAAADLNSPERARGLRNYLQAVADLIPADTAARRLPGYPTYAFGYGNTFVIAIDSNILADDTQYQWVKAQLEGLDRRRYPNIFVFCHHPPFSSGAHGGARTEPQSQLLRDRYLPLFRLHHVRAVLSGHDHLFEHWVERYTDASGTHRLDLITTGGGGAPLYAYRGEPDLTEYLAANERLQVRLEHLVRPDVNPGANPYHYVLVRVDGDRVDLEVIAVDFGRGWAPYRSSRTSLER